MYLKKQLILTRCRFRMTANDVDTVREAVKVACTSRVIAYRVEVAAISKKAA